MSDIIPLLGFYEPFSSLSHLLTAVVFLFLGIKLLINARGNKTRLAILLIYVLCNIFLFSMSGVYHLLQKGTMANYVLRVLDHSGIYLMICGSVGPFQIILMRGARRWIPLAISWLCAILGITFTSIFLSSMPHWLSLSFYIAMGWMGTYTTILIWKIHKPTAKLIMIGGLLYTFGAICDFIKWPTIIGGVLHPHEIFHIFVSAAAAVHFKAIYQISTLPITNKLKVKFITYPNKVLIKSRSERIELEAQSIDDAKVKLNQWIEANYLAELKPKKIIILYQKAELLTETS